MMMSRRKLRFGPSLVLLSFILAFGPETRSQSAGLERTLATLDYRVTWKISAGAADWEIRDFQMRKKHIYAIKSRKRVPGEVALYYRYSVRIEEFDSEADAEKRMAYVESTPPGADSKLIGPEFALREGFRRGRSIYVVSTDVYRFVADRSLSKFKNRLKSSLEASSP